MPRIIAVVGPTATGKSALGIELGQAVGGEVVNADSMQLYRGMDVGTAKVPPAERGGIDHHLLDLWEVTEPATAAAYQQVARRCLDVLIDRGVTPIVVGGSGLYLRAALDALTFPGTDADLRADLEAQLERRGSGALHERLSRLDPAAAAVILPSNGRRVVRALEVVALTGSYSATLSEYVPAYDVLYLGLEASDLADRIERRVAGMWAAGLVHEVRALEAAGLRAGRTASRALGYAQVLRMLDGTVEEATARADTVRATKRFARRQRAWFRRDPRIHWLTDRPAPADLRRTISR